MAASQSELAGDLAAGLAVRASASLETVQEALRALVARYRADEVLTAVQAHSGARGAVPRDACLGAA